MPITQDRMISLIEATDAVLQRSKDHRARVQQTVRIDTGPGGRIAQANEILSNPNVTIDEARRACAIIENVIQGWMEIATSVELPLDALLILEREKTHFKYNKRRNEMGASAVRTHRLRKRIAEELLAEGKTLITSPTNMPSLNTGIVESPLNKTPEEIDRDAIEARLRFEAMARGEDPDAVSSTYTREDYERDKAKRLSDDASPITVVQNTTNGEK